MNKYKTRIDLLPQVAIQEAGLVMAAGAGKYPLSGWRDKPASDHLAAAYRHLNSWARGYHTDPEDGCSHLSHAVCRLMFLVEKEYYGQLDGTIDFGPNPDDDPEKHTGQYNERPFVGSGGDE